ncbi:hypothetical protein E1180_10340 [Roseibium denhamense]|uniref:Uncharacterized protein n=1 Tax=Roseibium denhamense TaxID=76305 RepID=A0ABY1PKM9_9HYPH|nr:hypothetical protein [Roseibium denhamense]MTI05909.1 hypothetical protein [Roseibium denhamense]SMP35740.1 hypothetical protein SAMN06265374_4089 [Roseibium denhamense]
MQFILQIAGYILIVYVLLDGGTWFARYTLERSGAGKREKDLLEKLRAKQVGNESLQSGGETAQTDDRNNSGRYIGYLERALIVGGVIYGKWEVILAVIALKTVARHKELDEKIDAEYFLIGSFSSILWAVGCAVLLVVYDAQLGFQVLPKDWLFGAEGVLSQGKG